MPILGFCLTIHSDVQADEKPSNNVNTKVSSTTISGYVSTSAAWSVAGVAGSQAAFSPQAGEYLPAGALTGNQVFPAVGVSAEGGIVVWQDSAADGDGWGISAQRLNNNFSGSLSTFRVNVQGAGQQEHPRVAMLADGGAVFVWEGGVSPRQQIYARFMAANDTFITGDVRVNTTTNYEHLSPAIARLTDGNVIIVWSSFGQDGSLLGVYGQRFTPLGAPLGGEFQINQTTLHNQRTPAVAALGEGGFVVVWVSEASRGADPLASGGELFDVDIFGRIYDSSGAAAGGEFRVNNDRADTLQRTCANPSVAGLSPGGFSVAWGQLASVERDSSVSVSENSWDIFSRVFSVAGAAVNSAVMVNEYNFGDQFAPRIESLGSDQMVVWTSLAQDGSREGVYGRLITGAGDFGGSEFAINTTTNGSQFQPTVAADGATRFLVVWASYQSGTKMDLFAQRFASTQPLPVLPAPFVSALNSWQLAVSWSQLSGYPVVSYGLYVDGATTPIALTTNVFTTTNFSPGSTHSFRIDYVLSDGRRSLVSAAASGTTWGGDANFDGLPDDWQALYWGGDSANWPLPSADSDGDGVSNVDEFLAGTIPTDRTSALRTRIYHTPQGPWLAWNAQAGFVYQVVTSADLKTWTNVGGPRFAAGAADSIAVTRAASAGYYRVRRLR
ncbi:MAG: hypothetical protein HZA89_07355 [Verrucomicrobia bacterium]|nr:hypothetical protein [Verrucomicrobiota bacterium]